MSKEETLDINKLEYKLFQEIRQIRGIDTPDLEFQKDLYTVARKHATDFLKHVVKDIRANEGDRQAMFHDKRRFFEVSFVSPAPLHFIDSNSGEEESFKSVVQILQSNYASKFRDECINSIGAAADMTKSGKVVVVILAAFSPPQIPLRIFKRTFRPISSSKNPVDDFDFLIDLFNKFRSMINYSLFDDTNKPSDLSTLNRSDKCEEKTFKGIKLASTLFSKLLSDPHFFEFITEIWTGFSCNIESSQNSD